MPSLIVRVTFKAMPLCQVNINYNRLHLITRYRKK